MTLRPHTINTLKKNISTILLKTADKAQTLNAEKKVIRLFFSNLQPINTEKSSFVKDLSKVGKNLLNLQNFTEI